MNQKEMIESLLKDHPQGMSIEEISSRMKLNRQAVRVILGQLEGEGKITVRHIGQVKLNYWIFNKEDN